jgi:Probable transposase
MPKTVTIRREPDGWYVCFPCDQVPIKLLPLTRQETGIDLGLESFATLANSNPIENPHLFRVWEMQIKRAQRRVDRRHTGSHRRRKAVKILAKAHQKVRRARQDFHPQQAQASPSLRHDRSCVVAGGQPAQEPPSRQSHCGRGMEQLFEHPDLHSGRGWEAGRGGQSCVRLTSLFGLRGAGQETLVGPLA